MAMVVALTSLAVSGSSPDSDSPTSADTAEIAAPTDLPDDEFYTPPDPLPAGQPGDIIRSRPSTVGTPSLQPKVDSWQVMYLSTDALGSPTAVTGTVVVPAGADPATLPVIGLGPGTHGPSYHCAPSWHIQKGGFYEQAALNDMIDSGYAVAIPDYEGYQPQPETSYILPNATGPALIDSVRAAQRLPEAGLSADAPVVLRGYSQGGAAAMRAGEIHPDYAPEVDLLGVASGGVPADLIEVGLSLDGADAFGVVFYTMLGMDHAHPDFDFRSYLNEAGLAEADRMESEMCVMDLLTEYKGDTIAEYTAEGAGNPFLDPVVLDLVTSNKLGQQTIGVPVYQYHMTGDEFVINSQAETARNTYCGLGVDLTWETFDHSEPVGWIRHLQGIDGANPSVNQFIEDRLAGTPATNNC
jgi:pimeloyl-ACP methyl ester carboxylesterase